MGPQLIAGALFAGHRIEAVLGRGGMGVVYRARQLDLDRIVALKVVAPELLEDERARERFLAEARAAAAVDHAHVVPIYYVGERDGIAFLAMRYVEGTDVRALVAGGGVLGPGRAARIADQAGAALDAIHAAGFVHRDVKPANLLLADGDHVYVTDFGLAKPALTLAGPTRSGQWVGTLDYVAPEQIRGGRVDARADIYALGGVLHFMLTAHVPFERDTTEATLWAHLSEPPPAPCALRAGLAPAFDSVVARAMAKEPGARPPSAGDLGHAALRAAGAGSSNRAERMVARGAASPERAYRLPGLIEDVSTLTGQQGAPTPPERGRWRRWALAAGVVVLIGIAVAIVASSGTRPAHVGKTIAHVGKRPNAIAVVGNELWMTSRTLAQVTRVDAATGRLEPDPARVGKDALDIAAGPADVWVALKASSTLVQVDPRTGRVVRRVRTPLRPAKLAADAGGVWVVGRAASPGGPDELLRYDRDGTLLRRVSIVHGVGAILLAGGVLWVAELRFRRVIRVDTRSGRIREVAHLDELAFALTFGGGYLWATEPRADQAARIDVHTGNVVNCATGHQPAGLAFVGGRLFVANRTDHTVVAIDPRTTRRIGDPIRVALGPYAMTYGLGHIWVTGVGEDTLTRLDLT
jgi:predicted Ser/Thr protein kinase